MDAKSKALPAAAAENALAGPTYPHVKVSLDLTGEDGNAFAILQRAETALREAGVPASKRRHYVQEAMGGDFAQLLSVTKRWVSTYEGRASVRGGKRRR